MTGDSDDHDRSFRPRPKIGHLQSESAVTLGRNGRSRSNGISGQIRPEYALREAHARSLPIIVAEGVSIPFVSPAALTLLKLIAWSERGSAVNRKDARDLALLMTTYLRTGNEDRLYSEHSELLDEADFDFEAAGARILGRDLGTIAGSQVRAMLVQILDSGMGSSQGEPLLRALPLRPELARQLLQSLRKGLQEIAGS